MRLMTERLRQFHFQTIVCQWAEIVKFLTEQSSLEEYIEKRRGWFNRFTVSLSGRLDSELVDIIDDETPRNCWLQPLPTSLPSTENAGDLKELFCAYRELRIMHQFHYSNHKLRNDQYVFSLAPRAQDILLSVILLLAIFLIFAVHFWIGVSITFIERGPPALRPYLYDYRGGNDVLHVIVIWAAIVALAARAFQEGLQPEREVERYRHYRASVRAIRDRFDEAASPEQKFQIMLEMERLSFDELRNFLQSNDEARFVI